MTTEFDPNDNLQVGDEARIIKTRISGLNGLVVKIVYRALEEAEVDAGEVRITLPLSSLEPYDNTAKFKDRIREWESGQGPGFGISWDDDYTDKVRGELLSAGLRMLKQANKAPEVAHILLMMEPLMVCEDERAHTSLDILPTP
jgi:hypothetical protein